MDLILDVEKNIAIFEYKMQFIFESTSTDIQVFCTSLILSKHVTGLRTKR